MIAERFGRTNFIEESSVQRLLDGDQNTSIDLPLIMVIWRRQPN